MSNLFSLDERRKQVFQERVQESLGRIRPDYTIVGFLGQGSFGIVYEIQNAQHDTLCLKVLAIPGTDKPKVLDAVETLSVPGILEREKFPQQLNHPNIVDVVEGISITIDRVEIPCVVQKKIKGPTLEQYVREHCPLGRRVFAAISRGIAAGIGEIHRAGIAHRDLKLDNIKLDANNTPRIFDFSIAEKIDEGGAILFLRPAVPSQRYSAPEVQAHHYYDARKADVWSLGLILYELLAGENPQKGEILCLNQTHIPRRYRKVIRYCLQKDPNKRYTDGSAVYTALRHAEWYYAKRVGTAVGLPVFVCAGLALPLAKEMFGDRISTYYINECIAALEKQHNPREAEDFCQKAIAWNERNCFAYLELGHCIIEQRKDQEAEKAYRTAHRLCGKDQFRGLDLTILDQMRVHKLGLEERGMREQAEAMQSIYDRIQHQ